MVKVMEKDTISSRKNDHININLIEDVSSKAHTGFERFHFHHNALPEIDYKSIDTSQMIFGINVKLPVLISSMTGGTQQAAEINRRLAFSAEKFGLAMGVGSQRTALEDPTRAESFQIRKYAPNILLFANLGAVQLNYGYGIEQCKKAVNMIGANALILHLNPLQEAIQIEGNTNFSDLLIKIEAICKSLDQPVVVKEVGWGISPAIAKKLINVGVAGIDISGAGGTSWTQVERYRLTKEKDIRVAEEFRDWGLPTGKTLYEISESKLNTVLISSGGLKSGMDVAKSIALGAKLAGMAGVLLKKAVGSIDDLYDEIELLEKVLRIAMFGTGSGNIAQFQNSKIYIEDK